MSGESEFFDVVGGDASNGYTVEGIECGLAIVPLPNRDIDPPTVTLVRTDAAALTDLVLRPS